MDLHDKMCDALDSDPTDLLGKTVSGIRAKLDWGTVPEITLSFTDGTQAVFSGAEDETLGFALVNPAGEGGEGE